ncbi:MAG: mannonate dehydratase [Treponemataceae bacterium]|nr:mannonate dehydratase [Treponemataceae bacterium]
MKMTFRWFGTGFDSVSLSQIRQIPGVKGVITTLYDSVPGEAWADEKVKTLKAEAESHGLEISGIESVNIHDDIKMGNGRRDEYIENYIKTLEVLGKNDIRLVCYNFMPVFDWTRSELARVCEDGSTVLAYSSKAVDSIKPEEMFDSIDKDSNGFVLPGWEPERMAKVKELFDLYKGMTNEKLFENLVYFLKAIMPVCDKYDIDMAIHPDDPAWPVFGLPRIITCKENVVRMLKAVDNPHNGLTFCTGSYGTNRKNDLCEMIKAATGRIHFAHVRNLRFNTAIDDPVQDFQESAHLSSEGSFDMFKIIRTLYETGFDGVIRPDHGRMIWGEKAMPGYGLYDRALGACYLQGLWEACEKTIDRSGVKLYR